MDGHPERVVEARATVHLPGGIAAGGTYLIDTDSEYVRERIRARHLVPLEALPASYPDRYRPAAR